MLLERYYDESLAQASFLVGCERTREAIIIDPNRDVEQYLKAAAARRMTIRYVTETHIHADFLSGSRDLARAARATLVLSGHGGDDWSYGFAGSDGARLVQDGEQLELGNVRLQVMHTPGHTPEHIAFLLTDTGAASRPMGMFSGDFVFVGDVGRPDLLERAANVQGSMEGAARQLFASLQRLAALPDYLQLWPGHGAGSACGKSLGAVPQTTLGYERLVNPAFQQRSEQGFVSWVLADQPEAPRYFATMKRLNRDGPPPRPPFDSFHSLDGATVRDAIRRGDWVVDVRGSADFARLHLGGTINIPAARSLPSYAGTVLTYDRPIVLIARTREQAQSVIAQLALIGMDNVAGFAVLDVLQQLKDTGERLEGLRTVKAAELAAMMDAAAARVIDVRGAAEWNAGHLDGSTHLYLGDLEARMTDAPRDEPLVLLCQSGTRSSIGASLLRARGFTNVANLAGGVEAWRAAGLPVVRD